MKQQVWKSEKLVEVNIKQQSKTFKNNVYQIINIQFHVYESSFKRLKISISSTFESNLERCLPLIVSIEIVPSLSSFH